MLGMGDFAIASYQPGSDALENKICRHAFAKEVKLSEDESSNCTTDQVHNT